MRGARDEVHLGFDSAFSTTAIERIETARSTAARTPPVLIREMTSSETGSFINLIAVPAPNMVVRIAKNERNVRFARTANVVSSEGLVARFMSVSFD